MAFLISILDKNYTIDEFLQVKKSDLPNWATPIQYFLASWQKGKSQFAQETSGSTGDAKEIYIKRDRMIASAQNTIDALNIPTNAKALLCINANYIGGKMMLVRGLIANWHIHLIEPKSHLKASELWSHYDFAAMVPLQISGTLASADGQEILNRFDQIIIGGAPMAKSLSTQLQQLKCLCYSTFGMTETVSHIALKPLNGPNKSEEYRIIGDNEVKVDQQGRLMTKGSVTNHEWIQTNDLISITENGFEWLGRYDLIVNSGGVKIPIEATEHLIADISAIDGNQFIIWKQADSQLGERLIGICSSEELIANLSKHKDILNSQLPKYHFPKKWFLVDEIKKTKSGKVDRIKTAAQLSKEFSFE